MDIDKIVRGYAPAPEVATLLNNTPTVLFCGITAAGKDTIQKELLVSDKFTKIVTSTTRPPREDNGVWEQDGREYYFFSKEEAAEKVRSREYFEVANVHENFNGVTIEEVRRLHESGKIAIGDVNYHGVDYFHRHVPSVKAIFIVPPSYDVWHERMRKRYDTEEDFQAALPLRAQSAIKELRWALAADHCDIVVNDDLAEVVSDVKSIIGGKSSTLAADRAREVVSEILEKMLNT